MDAQQASIFVVEDDAAVRDGLALLFRLLSFRVSTFDSAQDCLEALSRETPRCIVTDLNLGGAMDGAELIEELVARKIETPVVVITGAMEGCSLVRRARKAGALTVLYKPCIDTALQKAVEDALAAVQHAVGEERAATGTIH